MNTPNIYYTISTSTLLLLLLACTVLYFRELTNENHRQAISPQSTSKYDVDTTPA